MRWLLASPFAFDDEFLELLPEEIFSFSFGDGSVLGDNGDRARANFEEARIGETGHYFLSGVGIDFELFTESTDGVGQR